MGTTLKPPFLKPYTTFRAGRAPALPAHLSFMIQPTTGVHSPLTCHEAPTPHSDPPEHLSVPIFHCLLILILQHPAGC